MTHDDDSEVENEVKRQATNWNFYSGVIYSGTILQNVTFPESCQRQEEIMAGLSLWLSSSSLKLWGENFD